jgi:hypothetical protein
VWAAARPRGGPRQNVSTRCGHASSTISQRERSVALLAAGTLGLAIVGSSAHGTHSCSQKEEKEKDEEKEAGSARETST